MSNPNECPVVIQPYDQSGQVRQPQIINLNYTNQDFWSMKSRLVNFMQERFGPNGSEIPGAFNDLVESDLAIMLTENWAFLADTLSFKMDQIANELYIDTVTEIENAFRIARAHGFKPQPPIAARSMFVATLNNPLTTDLRIQTPLAVSVSSNNQLISIELFQADSENNPMYDQEIIIPAGSTSSQSIIGLEGATRTEVLSGTGQPGQVIQLAFFPVIYDSIRVEVDGVPWVPVDYFTDSQPRREYRVEFDSNYNGYVIFGNNRAGIIPSPNSQIRLTYRIGGGPNGNIVTGFVDTQVQQAVEGLGYSVPVTLSNYTKGQYGYAGDTIEDIRRKLPMYVKTQDRAVSGDDYKTLAEHFATPYHGQVGKASAVLRHHGCAGNIVDLYILAKQDVDGLEEASSELKVDLYEEINKKKMLTDFVCIKDGEIILVDTSIDLTVSKFYRKFEAELRTNIQRKVDQFFSTSNWEFGQTLKDSDIIKAVAGIKEIEEVNVAFVTNDPDNSGATVTARFYQIIRPDQITISFLYT